MASQTPTNEDVRGIWDRNADFWNERMAEGNLFHLSLVEPAAEHLLAIEPDERVIEFACGNGQFSRRLAGLGASVFATDLSPRLVELARERTAERPELVDRLRFDVLDAADERALAGIEGAPFDAAVCNMAIMDMTEVAPLYRAVRRLLKPDGRFVFTIMHPCFNIPGGMSLTEEIGDIDGELVTSLGVRITKYRTAGVTRGLAIVGQPEKQWYFHRTLSELLGPAFAAGLILDGIYEPYLPDEVTSAPGGLSWRRFSEIPPVLAIRLRPASIAR